MQNDKSLGGLTAVSTMKIDAGDIQKFNRELEDRHRQFMDALNVYTAYRVQEIRQTTKSIKHKVETLLTEADYATIQRLPMEPVRLSSTRSGAGQPTRSHQNQYFWLCDIAGSGKSTVAMSAVEAWKKEGILGGTFFFSMAISEWSNTDKFCSTIARELAQYIPKLAPYIAKAWKRNPAILRSSFEEQFRMLIAEPLQHQRKRVILVIDAIDECKSGRQRKELVETLSAAAQESKSLRIFITSRPDPVIEKVLQPLSIKAKLTDRLHDTSHRDNIEDIATYVHQSLGQRAVHLGEHCMSDAQ
ncbi:related to archipelago beta form (F-box-WD40 repeat protein) [Serendipita indica DSM 11827]|uniref:Related to archipelago beta form (F-box-WD40 repeat protein) n=1 Tax=Serendipita indica (strain DSM 11827) TaxID=1109443 RepID=G4TVY3_SERID|nr:related to archipelago beta form (F-box-WD40 repeat protein) [Serendipita indica DSM 11827]